MKKSSEVVEDWIGNVIGIGVIFVGIIFVIRMAMDIITGVHK